MNTLTTTNLIEFLSKYPKDTELSISVKGDIIEGTDQYEVYASEVLPVELVDFEECGAVFLDFECTSST